VGMYTQPKISEDALQLIKRYREDLGIGREQLAQQVSELTGFPLSFFEYRSMENGQTKNVPFHVIIGCAIVLQIPAHELIPQLDA
jgi:hypothetical protein